MTHPTIITGAAGLIGSAIAHKFCEKGIEVIGTDILPIEKISGFQYHQIDSRDYEGLNALIKKGVSGIIHCGGVSGPMLCKDRPRKLFDINVNGTANILELARVFKLRRVIYCSSTSAYGNTPLDTSLIKENYPLNAVDVYGASKAAGDVLTNAYANQFELDAVALRFSWVYGPKRKTGCILREMILNAKNGKPSVFNFGKMFSRQYVHVDDVVNSVFEAWNSKRIPKKAYNITGGDKLSFDEIANIVCEIIPNANIRNLDSEFAGDLIHGKFDISAAELDLNYKPSVDFRNGVKKYASWLENHEY
jgi:UDP-glucuronate 4-epimerase